MFIPIVVFLVVLGVVYGIFHVTVLRAEEGDREMVRRRLLGASAETMRQPPVSFVKNDDDVTSFPMLDRILAPWHAVTTPLAERLSHADLRMTVGALIVVAVLIGVTTYAVTLTLFGYHWLALLVGALVMWVPFLVVRFKATRRIRQFEEQFPEAIDLLTRALRAGHAFTTALAMVADEGRPPVGQEFKKLYDEQNFGLPLPDALRLFAERVPLLDARFFVTAVLTQREAGGNLSEVLDNLARVIRERFKVKRQIRVVSAHARMSGSVLIALPPALAAGFMALNPDYMHVMFNDPIGPMLIGTGISLQVVGTLIIRKLINIEY